MRLNEDIILNRVKNLLKVNHKKRLIKGIFYSALEIFEIDKYGLPTLINDAKNLNIDQVSLEVLDNYLMLISLTNEQ
jgi:hypothetical protein